MYQCGCGEWEGEMCYWTGPREDLVVVEYMPECWRSSHSAARNSGIWPRNGAVRVAVHADCADRLFESLGPSDDWPSGCTWAEIIAVDTDDYAEPAEDEEN